MFLFRIIPGVLWLDILDKATDQCAAAIFGGFRLPCSLLVLFLWMSFLGELRIRVVELIHYVTVVHYNPHKTEIQRIYGQWQVRLCLCALLCGLSYYITFEFEDDFPQLQALKESIQNEKHNQKIDQAVHNDQDNENDNNEVFLMAHVYAQRILQQAQSIVWILGTLLRLKRARFLKLVALVWMLMPLGSFLMCWCGNFALWLSIGHVMMRAFDLTPQDRPRLGMAGCISAILVSTLYWRKYGTLEILLAVAAAIGGELAFQKALADVEEERKRREQNPGMLDKLWAALTGLFQAEEDDNSNNNQNKNKSSVGDGKKTDETKDDNADNTDATAEAIVYTRPSLYAWLAIAVYWAAHGIRLDGYDLFTF
ncbi:expressed unknown protein [Seminavis robusta]|uniref:Uncharacterized protein n=1 Tax=Seminavis robusta TaxID=568900 RepID=A0A9N8HX63_9STRA|nr:expressed unknown protein [Seminavis robusta]|eukprot:Sro2370_g325190.1 n/a (368) ;mRNA; r:6345-7448